MQNYALFEAEAQAERARCTKTKRPPIPIILGLDIDNPEIAEPPLAEKLAETTKRTQVVPQHVQHHAPSRTIIPTIPKTKTLHLAAYHGYTWAVRTQLALGADPNAQDGAGDSAMHVAAGQGYVGPVRHLVAYGGQVALVNHMRRTPLHIAAAAGYESVCVVGRVISICT